MKSTYFITIIFTVCILDYGYKKLIKYENKISRVNVVIMDSTLKVRGLACSYYGPNIHSDHGQEVYNLVTENVKGNYCVHFISIVDVNGDVTNGAYDEALSRLYTTNYKVDIVNLSLNSDEGGARLKERLYMKTMARDGTKFVVSAGNHGKNLDKNCFTFPACLKPKLKDQMYVVGMKPIIVKYKGKTKIFKGNRGKIVDKYLNGVSLTGSVGTSFSAPRMTNILLRRKINEQKRCSESINCRLLRLLRSSPTFSWII